MPSIEFKRLKPSHQSKQFIDDHDNMLMHFDYEIEKTNIKQKTGLVKKTIFRINNCSDKFISNSIQALSRLSCMICFILVVCKGDVETMIRNNNINLRIIEEWLLYFTIIWGRTCTLMGS